jgi:hypothetical protein
MINVLLHKGEKVLYQYNEYQDALFLVLLSILICLITKNWTME